VSDLLGPEMTAEGWRPVGDDCTWLLWLHAPSERTVSISPSRRDRWTGPTWGAEAAAPETEGYIVVVRRHDDLGNPVEGAGFWVESWGLAIRLGRAIRRHVLAERRPGRTPGVLDQLTLGDGS